LPHQKTSIFKLLYAENDVQWIMDIEKWIIKIKMDGKGKGNFQQINYMVNILSIIRSSFSIT
jgi:hypothetical protein